jgi:hypothetical protein
MVVTFAALSATSTPANADTPTQSATARVVAAANAFLSTLNDKQRSTVLYKFDDNKQRARWSNFPAGVVRRGGISLRERGDTQRSAAMALLASALS